MNAWSLRRRLLAISAAVMILAFAVIYIISQRAYLTANKMRLQDALVTQVYALMAQVDDSAGELYLPEELRNERLNNINSGLAAFLISQDGQLVWRSRSSDIFDSLPDWQLPYSLDNLLEASIDGRPLFLVGEKVTWEFADGHSKTYLFVVGEKQTMLNASVDEFSTQMLSWMAASAFLLLVVMLTALNHSLRPLKDARRQVEKIRMGQSQKIEGDFPSELYPLTNSINQLIEAELRQKTRYRDTLGNLAHSLKTPLAVIKSELEKLSVEHSPEPLRMIKEQVTRIDEIVRYQLNRSVVTSSHVTQRRTEVRDYAEKIVAALNKVYRDKQLDIQLRVSEKCVFPGEPGDFMELLGNLADNACKWARRRVEITLNMENDHLLIDVADDGPGIDADNREKILARGRRLDQQTEGQGLGLAIVSDIVAGYQGSIDIQQSALGGALFKLTIPVVSVDA